MAGSLRENYADRTEMPTALRLREARQRGQVARSGDLVAAVVVLGGVLLLGAAGPKMLTAMRDMTASMLDFGSSESGVAAAKSALYQCIWPVVGVVAIVAVGVAIVAILANIVQVGLFVTTEPLRADLSRLNPAAGMGRMFSMRSLVRVTMAVAKLAIIAALCFVAVRSVLSQVARPEATTWQIASAVGGKLYTMAVRIGIVLLVLAAADWLYQRWQYRQDLKMTRQEVLDELRQTEGSPISRQRRNKLAGKSASDKDS